MHGVPCPAVLPHASCGCDCEGSGASRDILDFVKHCHWNGLDPAGKQVLPRVLTPQVAEMGIDLLLCHNRCGGRGNPCALVFAQHIEKPFPVSMRRRACPEVPGTLSGTAGHRFARRGWDRQSW